MVKNSIAIVAASYNGKKESDKFVGLLEKQTIADKFDIIIVDNGSTDGTYEHLTSKYGKYDNLIILRAKENYGVSGGFCIGGMYAYDKGYEYIIYADNDAYAISNNLIEELVRNCDVKTVTFGLEAQDNYPEIKSEYIDTVLPYHYFCIHKKGIEKVGFPYFYYFLGFDDSDYTYNILKNNLKILRLNYVRYSHSKKSLIAGREIDYILAPMSRFLFVIRNQFLYFIRASPNYFIYMLKSIFGVSVFFIYFLLGFRYLFYSCFRCFFDFLFNVYDNKQYLSTNKKHKMKVSYLNYSEFNRKYGEKFIILDSDDYLLNKLNIPNLNSNIDDLDIKKFKEFFRIFIKSFNKNVIIGNSTSAKTVFSMIFFKEIYIKSIRTETENGFYFLKIKNNFRWIKILLLILMDILILPILFLILSLKFIFYRNVDNIKSYKPYLIEKK